MPLHDAKCFGGAHHDMRIAIPKRSGKSLAGPSARSAIDQDRGFHVE
jgi:hypothetical protein